jgi:hypothetical protein
MVRLRNKAVALVLGASLSGCSFAHFSPFHCDSCDDFPMPAYGPDFSMTPGSYTGPLPRGATEAAPPGALAPSSASPSAAPAPPTTPPTPPAPPVVSPFQRPST